MKTISICMSLLICFSACEEPVDLTKLGKYKELIVIHSALDNLGTAAISITYSVDAYKYNNPGLLGQANISFKENGIERALVFDSSGLQYLSDIIPTPGSSYSINVERNGYKTASATCFMPSLLQNKSVSLVPEGGIDQTGEKSDLLKITWKDNGLEKNYYKVNFYYYSELAKEFVPFDFVVTDPSLKAYDAKKTIDGGFLFSDELFDGKTKELTAVPPFGLVLANTTYKYLIQLRNISEEYYKYQTTLQDYRDAMDFGGDPFGGGVVIFTNINNGLGIFAGTVLESDTLK